MRNIQMVDLKSQYLNIKDEIDTAILDVVESTKFIKGPKVKEFEKQLADYLKIRHVISCANGTDALQVALMALELKPGDEIITTGFTFIATVEVVSLLGLKLVLADVDPNTFTICPDAIEKAITPKTKAIIPVHLFGQGANMDRINEIAKLHNLYIIEDTAQATGASFTFNGGKTAKLGTIGDIGTTSFFPSKNLGCYGDGGALFTNSDALAKIMTSITNHGMSVKYYHDTIGVNSRLDSIQAAILQVKLKYLDKYNKARQSVADYYDNIFKDINEIEIPSRNKASSHIFHQYTIKVKNEFRDELKKYLQDKAIPAMIYYPVPMHLQKAYANLGYKEGDFPVTEELCKSVLSLPIHTEMKEEELKYITETVKTFFNG